MTATTNGTDAGTIGYASSHATVRISAKRFEQSPYAARYVTEETIFGCYANRFYPLSLGGNAVEDYWKLRREAILYDVPEKPLDIKGPDAVTLLERVFSRRVGNLKRWRARYAIACTPQGNILMDGVLIRLAKDHFWYVRADGEFESWLFAHSNGLDVTVSDPHSWVLQIQGPKSLAVLNAATDGQLSNKFCYFHARIFNFGGQELLVTRTGWTGEMGFEVYSKPTTEHLALWDHLMASGKAYGMTYASLDSMGIRRIEAGILDNGTDMDRYMTPFAAGLGAFVDLSKPEFIGRAALEKADRRCLLFGFISQTGIPSAGLAVLDGDPSTLRPFDPSTLRPFDKLRASQAQGIASSGHRKLRASQAQGIASSGHRHVVGNITAGSWSPTLKKGIGYVRFHAPARNQESWLAQMLTLRDHEGNHHEGEVVSLPFYDAQKRIPRGLAVAEGCNPKK